MKDFKNLAIGVWGRLRECSPVRFSAFHLHRPGAVSSTCQAPAPRRQRHREGRLLTKVTQHGSTSRRSDDRAYYPQSCAHTTPCDSSILGEQFQGPVNICSLKPFMTQQFHSWICTEDADTGWRDAPWVEHWRCKQEDPSSSPQHPCGKRGRECV